MAAPWARPCSFASVECAHVSSSTRQRENASARTPAATTSSSFDPHAYDEAPQRCVRSRRTVEAPAPTRHEPVTAVRTHCAATSLALVATAHHLAQPAGSIHVRNAAAHDPLPL